MTDQFQWQGALAAAEHAIDTEQIEAAESSLQSALTHIGTYEPNDPARLPILAALIRCCERAIELAEKSRPRPWQHSSAKTPADIAALRKPYAILGRLRDYHFSAHSMLLDSQVAQLGEDSATVVETLLTMERLAWTDAGHEDDSFALLQRALAIRERTLGSEHPDTIEVVWRLASRYDTYSSYGWAMPLWQRLLAHVEQYGPLHFGHARHDVPQLLLLLGKAYDGLRLYGEAKEVWKRYLDLTENESQQTDNRLPPMQILRLNVYYSIGRACLAQKEWLEAVEFLALAIENHRTVPGMTVNRDVGPSGINLASGIAAYARALSNSDRQNKAIPLFEEAISLDYNIDHQYVELLRDYASALQASGDIPKATIVEVEAAALLESIEAKKRRRGAITAALLDPE